MKILPVLVLAATLSVGIAGHAGASASPVPVAVPEQTVAEAREPAVRADPLAAAIPAAPTSGWGSWLVMAVVLGLTGGAKRGRKVRAPDEF